MLGLDGLTKRFKEDCLSDPLLKYMWRARDAVAHDTIISWNNRGHLVQIEVFDAEKANAVPRRFSTLNKEGGNILDLLAYIYEANSTAELDQKAKENFRPSERAMETAGVKLVYAAETILLHEFSYRAKEQGKKITIARPTTHLGKQIPAQADIASEETIKFYDAMLDLARTLLNALATRPQATGMP